MTKYNELQIDSDGTTFLFVTRGKARPFTPEEAEAYLAARTRALLEDSVKEQVLSFPDKPIVPKADAAFDAEPEAEPEFQIPDDKMRRIIFQRDLRQMGVKFCADKYGVSEEAIEKEAQRITSLETKRG